MKAHFLYLALILVAIAVLWPTPSRAQTDDTVVVNVPFAFHVNNTVLPAGSYRFIRSGRHPGWLLMVSAADPSRTGFISVVPADSGAVQSEVKFQRYGEAYFLSEVSDGAVKYALHPTAAELELARKAAEAETTTIRASK